MSFTISGSGARAFRLDARFAGGTPGRILESAAAIGLSSGTAIAPLTGEGEAFIMHKLSARVGENWLVLTRLGQRTWHLQVLGKTPLEAEVTAEDEAAAKSSAVAATVERLRVGPLRELPIWNVAVTKRWERRGHGRAGSFDESR